MAPFSEAGSPAVALAEAGWTLEGGVGEVWELGVGTWDWTAVVSATSERRSVATALLIPRP
jgi:hypothetical protein